MHNSHYLFSSVVCDFAFYAFCFLVGLEVDCKLLQRALSVVYLQVDFIFAIVARCF